MKKLVWLFSLLLLAFACQEDQLVRKDNRVLVDSKTSSASVDCTEGATTDIIFNETVIGTVTVSDASADLSVSIDLSGDEYFLLSDSVWAGNCQAPALVHGELLDPNDEVRLHNFEISLANLPECGCAYGKAEIARFNERTSSIEIYILEQRIEYCKCPEEDGQLRTQTQGGWGAKPKGNNPGVYVHANFAGAFPNGLVVGCTYKVTLTSAQAVTDFLPNSGVPSALTQNYTNSGSSPGNTLAGQVVACKLSVGFDWYDANFGEASSSLSDAVVTSGTFTGWTVAQVLAEGEKKLGGCASVYTASQLNDALSSINECFVDGTTNTGFLDVQ